MGKPGVIINPAEARGGPAGVPGTVVSGGGVVAPGVKSGGIVVAGDGDGEAFGVSVPSRTATLRCIPVTPGRMTTSMKMLVEAPGGKSPKLAVTR